MQTSILWTLYFWGSDLLKPSTTILNEAVSIKCDIWKIKSSPKRNGHFIRLKTIFKKYFQNLIFLNLYQRNMVIYYHWVLRFSEVFKQILMSNPMAPQFNNWSKRGINVFNKHTTTWYLFKTINKLKTQILC